MEVGCQLTRGSRRGRAPGRGVAARAQSSSSLSRLDTRETSARSLRISLRQAEGMGHG